MKAKLSWVLFAAAFAGVFAAAGYVIAQQKPAPEVRRVVTKLDDSGRAVVMFDGKVQLKSFRSPNPAGEMWVTDKSLPDFNFSEDRALTKVGLTPPKSGTIFRVVDFAPNAAEVAK